MSVQRGKDKHPKADEFVKHGQYVGNGNGVAKMKQLLADGCPVNVRDRMGKGALHHAALRSNLHNINWLLRHGADTEIEDKDGRTPFFYAAADGRVESMMLLMKNGAQYRAVDRAGNTALHYMAERNPNGSGVNDPCTRARLLIDYGINPKERNNAGQTAADVMQKHRRKNEKLLETIINYQPATILSIDADGGAGDASAPAPGPSSVVPAAAVARSMPKDEVAKVRWVLVVVNNQELAAVTDSKYLKKARIVRVGGERFTTGKIGREIVVVSRVPMGTGAVLVGKAAMLFPSLLGFIMVGVAFGLYKDKPQQLGDVLVSTGLHPYDSNIRVNQDASLVPRGLDLRVHDGLLDWIRASEKSWKPHNKKNKAYFGPYVSGRVLVDNTDMVNALKATYPTAIGGEMEGLNVGEAALNEWKHWIIVKGISDWADGSKTKEWQPIAARNAMALVCNMIENVPPPRRLNTVLQRVL